MPREGFFLLHKGEPVIPLRHDCAIKLHVMKVKLSEKQIDKVVKEIKESLAKYFNKWGKPKKAEKKVWSVS